MILKHSLRSIIRVPKKTILFLFLLIVLTIFLNIGAGMYASTRNMLSDADRTFTSVVELDYLGDAGGDEAGFYKNMNSDLSDFNFTRLANQPEVKSVNMEKTAWAYIDDKTIKRSNTPLNNFVMVKVGSIIKNQGSPYMGIVTEVLYGKKARRDAYILINDVDEQGNPVNYNFSDDHEYLIIGEIAIGRTATFTLSPCLPEPAENIPNIIDLTENPDFFHSDEGKQILSLQEAMAVVDNSYQVITVSSLEASAPYYFNELLLKEGRIFSPFEYQEGKNRVILISEAIADFYQIKAGDVLPLKLHYNKAGIGRSNFLKNYNFDYEATYEVVGVFENKADEKYIIYMPQADWLEQQLHSKTVAGYIVKNGAGKEFIEDNKESLLPNMEFTLYDQGYEEAVKPIRALKNSAVLIIVLSCLSGLAILSLFSYLYVIKQKDTLKTMLSLGTGKRRTMDYILCGSVALVFCASIIGAIISSVLQSKVTEIVFNRMMANYGTDSRYSERSIGLQMNFVPQIRVNLWIPAIVIIVILLVSFILLLSFAYYVLREDNQFSLRKEKRKEKNHSPRKTKVSNILFGRIRPITLKFALVSLTRSPGRSFIVPVISLILSVFIIYLGLLSNMQQEKLDTVYDRIPVTAYITTPSNETRDIGVLDLLKDIYQLIDPEFSDRVQGNSIFYLNNEVYTLLCEEKERDKILSGSDYFNEMYLYSAIHYEYMGISATKNGEENIELSQYPEIRIHNNAYGFDWFLNKINKMPKLAYADNLRYTPDFFNDPEPEVEFLEGYGFDSLRLQENVGLISENFAAANSVENGDVIRITAWFGYGDTAVCSIINFKVIGIYDAKWRTDTVYLPWNMIYAQSFFADYEYPLGTGNKVAYFYWNEILTRRIRAATFTLKNTEKLNAFRDYLETEGYSRVGKAGDIRRAIVIQDKHLVETIQNLKNHIRLIDTIKPIMLILFGILGFAVSYLLIKHRMYELAVMRSMGAKKRQVFITFFTEQLILFTIGLIPAAVYAFLQPDKVILYGGSLIYFILCYQMGTALAVIIMNRAKVLNLLLTKE